jgi:hypothetical protein
MKNALLSLTLIVAQQLIAVAPVYACTQADGATTIHIGLHGCVAQQLPAAEQHCCCQHRQHPTIKTQRSRARSAELRPACCGNEHARLPAVSIARLETSASRTNHAWTGFVLFAQAATESRFDIGGICLQRSWPAPAAQCELPGDDAYMMVLRC